MTNFKFWRWFLGGRWIKLYGSWERVISDRYCYLDKVEQNRVLSWPKTEDHRWFRGRPYKTRTIYESGSIRVTALSNGSTLLAVKGLGGWNVENISPYELCRLGESLTKRGKEFSPDPFMGIF